MLPIPHLNFDILTIQSYRVFKEKIHASINTTERKNEFSG